MSNFQIDDKVRMTQIAIDMGLNRGNAKYPSTTTGIVTSQRGDCVYVLRDGRKIACSYHEKFWKHDDS